MLALRASGLWDGTSAGLRERATVLVEAGRVVAVDGPGVDPPAHAELVDLGEVTLLPGLVDTHVHLGFDAGPDPVAQMVHDDDATLLLRMARAARVALAAGITTVRDLGDRGFIGLTLRRWFAEGGELGPTVVAAGPPLTITGGHCHFMGGVADDEGELRRAVRRWATKGVDVVKVMAGGGQMTAGVDPTRPQYTAAELAAVVEEAHRYGLPVTAHAHGAVPVARAVEAGVDGIEHGGFWVAEGVRSDPAVIDAMAERGVVVAPTTAMLPGAPPPSPPVARRLDAIFQVVGHLHRAGVRLVAGTDAGVAPAKPFDLLPRAVAQLADLGLSNVEALVAATSGAAAACGLAGRKGVVAPAADADLVAVAGDPLVDLTSLRDVRAVFRGGVRV